MYIYTHMYMYTREKHETRGSKVAVHLWFTHRNHSLSLCSVRLATTTRAKGLRAATVCLNQRLKVSYFNSVFRLNLVSL